MAIPLNVPFSLAGAATVIIPLNRFGPAIYTVEASTGAVLVEGTSTNVNRPEGITPHWDTLNDTSGSALTAVNEAAGVVDIQNSAISAIRLTATGTTVGTLTQQGLLT